MFRDKHVIVTGGSSGLGLALGHALAKEGARVTLIARSAAKLAEAKAEIERQVLRADVAVATLDVTNEAEANATLARIAGERGGIDILINNAGIMREGYFETLPMSDFRDVMETNFFGVLHVTRAALPFLRASKGKLVNIASAAGLMGVFGYTSYCAAKHALVGVTESLRYELEPQGISVQLVCPAEFDSPLVDALEAGRTPENKAHVLMIPKAGIEPIVAGVMAGLRTRKFRIIPGALTRIVIGAFRFSPGFVRGNADRAIRKVYTGPPTVRA